MSSIFSEAGRLQKPTCTTIDNLFTSVQFGKTSYIKVNIIVIWRHAKA